MADPKNEPGKPSSADKQTGAGAGGKVSAGTSVGNIGETPMPHAQEGAKSGQSSASATQAAGAMDAGQGGERKQSKDRSSQQGSSQGQSGSMTDQARQAASQTGERVRETAEQMRHKAGDMYEDTSEWAQDTYERASGWASDTYEQQRRRMGDMRSRSMKRFGNVRGGVQNYVAENPMVVGLVGLAAGLLLGALLPRTRREDAMFGEWADEMRSQGLRYAREATNKGREYVEETLSGDETPFGGHESDNRPDRSGPDTGRR